MIMKSGTGCCILNPNHFPPSSRHDAPDSHGCSCRRPLADGSGVTAGADEPAGPPHGEDQLRVAAPAGFTATRSDSHMYPLSPLDALQAQQINMQAMNLAQQQTQEQQKKQEVQKKEQRRGREEERNWKRRTDYRPRSRTRSPSPRSPSPRRSKSRSASARRPTRFNKYEVLHPSWYRTLFLTNSS